MEQLVSLDLMVSSDRMMPSDPMAILEFVKRRIKHPISFFWRDGHILRWTQWASESDINMLPVIGPTAVVSLDPLQVVTSLNPVVPLALIKVKSQILGLTS